MNPPESNLTPIEPIAPIVSAETDAHIVPAAAGVPSAPATIDSTIVPTGTATPVAAPSYRTQVAIGARRPGVGARQIAAVGGLLLLGLLAFKLTHTFGGNKYEATADAVTMAIVNNNMKPVEPAFNAINYPELENRAQVGRLSDILARLGAFKGSKEITPSGSAAGLHEFTENFANGTKFEKFELDADGKILHFHIGDPPETPTTP